VDGKTALLVLDMQRDFLEDAGRLPVARDQVAGLIASTNALIESAAASGALVVYILNAFPRSAWLANLFRRGAAIEGSTGAELDPRVLVRGSNRFTKTRGDAFSNRALEAYLRERGVERVIIVGVFANACVKATVRGALARGFGVTIVRDGVAAGDDRARRNAIAAMERRGALVRDAAVCS
jgi:nicotinamidase-related amidase